MGKSAQKKHYWFSSFTFIIAETTGCELSVSPSLSQKFFVVASTLDLLSFRAVYTAGFLSRKCRIGSNFLVLSPGFFLSFRTLRKFSHNKLAVKYVHILCIYWDIRFQWLRGLRPWVYGRSLFWNRGFESLPGVMAVCLLWMLCVVRCRSLRGTDHLSTAGLSRVACLSVMVEPDNVEVLVY